MDGFVDNLSALSTSWTNESERTTALIRWLAAVDRVTTTNKRWLFVWRVVFVPPYNPTVFILFHDNPESENFHFLLNKQTNARSQKAFDSYKQASKQILCLFFLGSRIKLIFMSLSNRGTDGGAWQQQVRNQAFHVTWLSQPGLCWVGKYVLRLIMSLDSVPPLVLACSAETRKSERARQAFPSYGSACLPAMAQQQQQQQYQND